MFWRFLLVSSLLFCSAANGQPVEVHAVAVYEGDVRTDGNVHGPRARLSVDRQGADVILVLGSYEAVRWIIETSPKTSIDRIYVHGHQASRSEVFVNGIQSNTEVLKISSTHRKEGVRFRALVDFLSEKFEVRRIASFQGAYTAPDEPFVVDRIQEATVNQVDYLRPQTRPEALTAKLRQFLEGTNEPVARLKEDGFYLLKDDEEVHFPITLDVPNVSWPGRATYDPVNQRLHAGTAWHVGFFYTYDILNDRWSAFEQPRGMRIHGAIYDAEKDRLILGVEGHGGSMNSSRLIEMRALGEMTKIPHDVLLGLTDLEDVGNGPNAILIPLAIDGDLLLAKGQARFARSVGVNAHRTYLIDLKTGQVILVGLSD